MVRHDFMLWKSMSTPSHFLTSHVLGNGFQGYLLCHLLIDWGEAHLPLVFQIFLLALFEDRNDICYLNCYDHPKITENRFTMMWASYLSIYRYVLSSPTDLVVASLFKYFLICSFSSECKSSLVWTFTVVSGAGSFLEAGVRTEVKKALSTLPFLGAHQGLCPIQCHVQIFFVFPLQLMYL